MMIVFYAQRVIDERSAFEAADKKDPLFIPTTLRQAVAELLIETGVDFLVPVEYGGTKA